MCKEVHAIYFIFLVLLSISRSGDAEYCFLYESDPCLAWDPRASIWQIPYFYWASRHTCSVQLN